MPNFDNILDFYLSDYSRTLFPMETNRIIITAAVTDIADFIYKKILKDKTHHFLQQTRVYASKPRMHLRRTVKLDPIAEFFIYDLVYRNRQSFRGDFNIKCNNYGFRFQSGKLISPRASYRNFKKAVREMKRGRIFTACCSKPISRI